MPIIILCLFALSIVGCTTQHTKQPAPQKTKAPSTPVPTKETSTQRPASQKLILMTIDDLPVAMRGMYSPKQRETIAQKLCAVLTKHNIPTLGFVNMKWAKDDAKALEHWKTCKVVTLGNHTWSHPHMRRVGLAAYKEDLKKGHEAIKAIVPKDQTIYFRYPYLFEGHDPSNQRAVRQLLDTLKSPNVPVTIDTSDWYYARGYAKALNKNNAAEAERFRQSWFWDLEETTRQAENEAHDLLGRQPPQVLLLHANRLNADHLDAYILWLKKRGYHFTTVEKTLADPAYKTRPMSSSPRGINRWKRLRRHRTITSKTTPK